MERDEHRGHEGRYGDIKHRAEDLTAQDPRLKPGGGLRSTSGRTPSLSQATPGMDRSRRLRDLAMKGVAYARAALEKLRERRRQRRGGRRTTTPGTTEPNLPASPT